ncbi:hypothetical protein BJY00DRAFT_297786 [Aspergillus carlsbadensis]|nr:hypothetical protein BJY00DRAFT_297786 [Aspergillus carlsbadensis]
MHGILGLLALYLASLKPKRHSHYLASAGFHMSLGFLIIIYIHGSPIEPSKSCMARGLNLIIKLLSLCQGTLILHPYFKQVQQSPLKQLFMREFAMDNINEPIDRTTIFKGLTPQLISLQTLITSKTPNATKRSTLLQALDRLKASFTCIISAPRPLECGMLYMWPLSIKKQFFDFLQTQHPMALVILAFYSVQLYAFKDYWFISGQGAAWLGHVKVALEGRLSKWLLWPRGVLSEGPAPDGGYYR